MKRLDLIKKIQGFGCVLVRQKGKHLGHLVKDILAGRDFRLTDVHGHLVKDILA